MLTDFTARLRAAVAAALPDAEVSVRDRDDRATWTFTRPPGATPQQVAAAQSAIDAFDPSIEAQAAWELDRTRYAALTGLLTRGDDIGIGVRAVTRAIVTLINDRLEALGQPRVMEAEILGLIAAVPTIGDPV